MIFNGQRYAAPVREWRYRQLAVSFRRIGLLGQRAYSISRHRARAASSLATAHDARPSPARRLKRVSRKREQFRLPADA